MITDNDLILVTGASGYIATHIVKQLLELGYRVRGTVRSLKNEEKVKPLRTLAKDSKHELELVEADLCNEESWLSAVKDCTYVLHTASPFPPDVPKNEDELIVPAVNGTLFVFRACVQEGSLVKRVVLTSSVAAIAPETFVENVKYSETDWPSPEGMNPYPKSKVLAEKAAWDFCEERKKNGQSCFELSVINPGFVMGPLIHDTYCTSAQPIRKMMMREIPMIPDIYAPVCDVRDVALAHIKAMTSSDALSKRHLIVNQVVSSSFKDWALILKDEFESKNYSIPTRIAPYFLLKIFSFFDSSVKIACRIYGIKSQFDNSNMLNNLSIKPYSLKDTLIDMAYSMIERKMIEKKYND